MPEKKKTVQEKLARTKVTVDRSLEERARQRQVPIEVPVEGARGAEPLTGQLSFEQLKAGGFIKQRQKDLFTVRCRCPGGRIPAEGIVPVIRTVLDWYREHGKGRGRTRIGDLLKEPGAMDTLRAARSAPWPRASRPRATASSAPTNSTADVSDWLSSGPRNEPQGASCSRKSRFCRTMCACRRWSPSGPFTTPAAAPPRPTKRFV